MASWRLRLRRGQRRIAFLTARALMRRFGFSAARRIGTLVGALEFHLRRKDRRRCLHDMALLQNRRPGDPVVTHQLRDAYRVYATAVLELLAMFDRKLQDEVLFARCKIDGLPLLEAARTGRGAILLATHSGNSFLLAAQLARRGLPVTVVYRHSRMMSAHFFAKGLPLYGLEGILANEGLKAYTKMLRALRANRILFVMIDQGVKFAKDGRVARFLGKDMPMPVGPAHLARNMEAPVLPLVALAIDPDWHFAIEPPITTLPGSTLEQDMEMLLQITERQVLDHPHLWSWQHRRWRKFPLAAPVPPAIPAS